MSAYHRHNLWSLSLSPQFLHWQQTSADCPQPAARCKQTRAISQLQSRDFCVNQSETELSRGIFLMLQFLFVSDVFPRCFTARCDPLCDDSTSHKDNLNKNWISRTIDLNIRRRRVDTRESIAWIYWFLISTTQRQRVSRPTIIDHWPTILFIPWSNEQGRDSQLEGVTGQWLISVYRCLVFVWSPNECN